jgi:hypothetical protein
MIALCVSRFGVPRQVCLFSCELAVQHASVVSWRSSMRRHRRVRVPARDRPVATMRVTIAYELPGNHRVEHVDVDACAPMRSLLPSDFDGGMVLHEGELVTDLDVAVGASALAAHPLLFLRKTVGMIMNKEAQCATEDSALVWAIRFFTHLQEKGQHKSDETREYEELVQRSIRFRHMILMWADAETFDLMVRRCASEDMKQRVVGILSDFCDRSVSTAQIRAYRGRDALHAEYDIMTSVVCAVARGNVRPEVQLLHRMPVYIAQDGRKDQRSGVVPWAKKDGDWYAYLKVEVSVIHWTLKVEPLRVNRKPCDQDRWATAVRAAKEESAGLIDLSASDTMGDLSAFLTDYRPYSTLHQALGTENGKWYDRRCMYHIAYAPGIRTDIAIDKLAHKRFNVVGLAWVSKAVSAGRFCGHLLITDHSHEVLNVERSHEEIVNRNEYMVVNPRGEVPVARRGAECALTVADGVRRAHRNTTILIMPGVREESVVVVDEAVNIVYADENGNQVANQPLDKHIRFALFGSESVAWDPARRELNPLTRTVRNTQHHGSQRGSHHSPARSTGPSVATQRPDSAQSWRSGRAPGSSAAGGASR